MSYLANFHYQISGNPQGHKLVFLHGVMGSSSNWLRITPAFQKNFHILTFDQRGHGRSFQPETGYSPRDYAADLHQILLELGWSEIFLVGHSMGARNAMEFATYFAQMVKVLVLEDIGPEASSGAMDRIEKLIGLVPTPFANREEAKKFFNETYPDLIRFYPQSEVVAKFLFSNIEQKTDGTQDWRFSKSAILQTLQTGRNQDRWDQFRNLKVPVLVVRGAESKDLSAEIYQRMLKELPHAQGVEIPAAGHWVHFDQPEAFIHTLNAFFHPYL